MTVITHGYDGDVTGWIKAMASKMPGYFHSRYPGLTTNFTIYTVALTTDGNNNYFYQWTRNSGPAPSNSDTGEIIVKLDWSQMAGSPTDSSVYDISTYNVAAIASYVLSQTNIISELNGHALAEFPMHLIGHSRGGSLISEISRLLGTNGLWVDHLTTLDPHPLNNDGNSDPVSQVDAPVHTYANVLFHDNYWQNIGDGVLVPRGEAVAGAYVRQLTALDEGYPSAFYDFENDYEYHSNVHLWYHGTIDLKTPTSYNDDGTTVTIDATMRANWWAPSETQGTNAGLYYSLIGGGNRTSTNIPLGVAGAPQIRNGYNQNWDLGGGTNANRTALTSNNGSWPNIIKFNITGTNSVTQGTSFISRLYYQYGGASNLTMQIFFDADLNPFNSNSVSVMQLQPPASGTSSVSVYSSLALSTTNITPGVYAVYAKITDGKNIRYLYAPESVQVIAGIQHPVLDVARNGNAQIVIGVTGVSGQKIIFQRTSNFQNWTPVVTNTLVGTRWNYTNSLSPTNQFYRVLLSQ